MDIRRNSPLCDKKSSLGSNPNKLLQYLRFYISYLWALTVLLDGRSGLVTEKGFF